MNISSDDFNKIKSVLNGEEENVYFENMISPCNFEKIMIHFNLKRVDIDSNGWQHDFWITYIHRGTKKQFVFAGSWYYGDYRFSIDKGEDL